MTRMIEDEIEASSAFADWKILTENEEVALEADRENLVSHLAALSITIAEEEANLVTLST